MKKIGKNAISNIITKLWSLISIYLFIPFYINLLGEESYGIVSFFATMQSAINLLGLGLANTLRREFAVKTINEKEDDIRRFKLLHSIEFIYFCISLSISIICFFSSDSIALNWLNIGSLDSKYVSNVITLMGISISIQILANLYSGCIFGLDQQTIANFYNIIWSIIKYCGSLLILIFIDNDLRLFYSWHVVSDIIYVVVLRVHLKNNINVENKKSWRWIDFSVLGGIWKYAAGIFFISIIALVNKQLDKIIISNLLTLTDLGAYNLATTLGSLTTIFAAAMYVSVFPGFTKDISSGSQKDVKIRFLKINKMVNIVTACLGCFIAVYSIPLIQIWTGSNTYNEILKVAAPLVVLAITMIEFQEIPYALALAFGNTKINVLIGLVFMPLICIFTWIFIKNAGLTGAGAIYLIMMGLQTLVYEYLIYKKYITEFPIKLIVTDTVLPIMISILSAITSYLILYQINVSNSIIVLMAIICGAITLLLELIIFKVLKLKGNKLKRR